MSKVLYRTTQNGEKEPVFSFADAADILGMTGANVSNAVSRGAINTVEIKGERYRKIPASEITSYANRTGRNVKKITDRIQNRTGGGNFQTLAWILAGLGLGYFLKYINRK